MSLRRPLISEKKKEYYDLRLFREISQFEINFNDVELEDLMSLKQDGSKFLLSEMNWNWYSEIPQVAD